MKKEIPKNIKTKNVQIHVGYKKTISKH